MEQIAFTTKAEQVDSETPISTEESSVELFKEILAKFAAELSEFETLTGNKVAINVALSTPESEAKEEYYPFSYFGGDVRYYSAEDLEEKKYLESASVFDEGDVTDTYSAMFIEDVLDFSLTLTPEHDHNFMRFLRTTEEGQQTIADNFVNLDEGVGGILIEGQLYSFEEDAKFFSPDIEE
jgi:hypothetical protein